MRYEKLTLSTIVIVVVLCLIGYELAHYTSEHEKQELKENAQNSYQP